MITFGHTGSFRNTEKFFTKMSNGDLFSRIKPICEEGVRALSAATPVGSGIAAQSWGYEIHRERGGVTIYWTNSNIENGFPVAIMLQYGHGTGTGGYVQGRDYINPAMKPIFDKIADDVWKAVTSA